jgi:predicted GNAT family acetyltransferase
MPTTDTTVRNATDRSRYELVVDDRVVGIADYRIDGDVVVFPHTEIARELRGRGYGAILVQAALDDVRTTGRRVVPACWYVAEFIDGNPDYADLLAA